MVPHVAQQVAGSEEDWLAVSEVSDYIHAYMHC